MRSLEELLAAADEAIPITGMTCFRVPLLDFERLYDFDAMRTDAIGHLFTRDEQLYTLKSVGASHISRCLMFYYTPVGLEDL